MERPALAHHLRNHRIRQRQRCGGVDGDKAVPLIRRDLPEFERALPAVRPDCTWADAGVVDEDVDVAEPIAGSFGDLLDCGVINQIGLNWQLSVAFAWLRASAAKGGPNPREGRQYRSLRFDPARGSGCFSERARRVPIRARKCPIAISATFTATPIYMNAPKIAGRFRRLQLEVAAPCGAEVGR